MPHSSLGALAAALFLTAALPSCEGPQESASTAADSLAWWEVYPDLAPAALLEATSSGVEARWAALQESGALWDAIEARHAGAAPEQVVALALGLGETRDCEPRPSWGAFQGEPDFEDPGPGGELTTLRTPFVFNDDRKFTVRTAPVPTPADDWSWNGASIPPFMRWAVGQPREGCYALASIHHDYYYQSGEPGKPGRRATDRIFYRGMRANGVGKWKARSFYWAVWTFGGLAYKSPTGDVEPPAYVASEEEFLEDWLEVCALCYLDALEHPEDDGFGLTLDDLESLTADEITPGFALTIK